MQYAPKLKPIESSASYNVGLDVVLSEQSIQEQIL
jgi:hypothetical protein